MHGRTDHPLIDSRRRTIVERPGRQVLTLLEATLVGEGVGDLGPCKDGTKQEYM